MKTPMQQLFYRIEQLRFAKNPIDELMMIRLEMLEKEKEFMKGVWLDGRNSRIKCQDPMEQIKNL